MSVLIGTSAGARLVLDVAVDSVCDRLSAMSRHLGAPASWTVNTGAITVMRDGADGWEFEVEVTGPLSGPVQLRAPGPQVVATTPVLSLAGVNDKALVRFRVSRARDKEIALSSA